VGGGGEILVYVCQEGEGKCVGHPYAQPVSIVTHRWSGKTVASASELFSKLQYVTRRVPVLLGV